MALIKSKQDIVNLRTAGKYLAEVLVFAQENCLPGVKLADLDKLIEEQILKRGCTPSFKGHEGYPAASCLSLNDQVVHGIPDQRVLKEGDLLGIDLGLWFNHVCVDAAKTVWVGGSHDDESVQRLLEVTEEALSVATRVTRPFTRIGAISSAVEHVAQQYNLGIVRRLTGHGVGHAVHEEPAIPNYGRPSDGMLLKPGMVLAIEPMFTLGSGDVFIEPDGWGVLTADHSLSAHFEHTVLVTKTGCEVLTKLNNDSQC